MWIAKTSISDGIAIVAFATVLFLLLFGSIAFVRRIYRIICGKSSPEAVILVFPTGWQMEEDKNGDEDLENFAWFLHSKLRENQLGHFSEFCDEDDKVWIRFEGTDANQIWQLLHSVAKYQAPKKPLRVILERSKKTGGKRILDDIPWQPASTPVPRPALVTVPETWIRLSHYGLVLTRSGIVGILAWGISRKILKQTENEFRDTLFGNYSAWIIGILLITGLALRLISSIKIRSIQKQTGFPTKESPTSVILKYVLLAVILIFGSVLLLLV